MRTFEKRPAMRWIAPVAALAVAAGGVLATQTASADVTLPDTSAQQLVAKVVAAKAPDYYGTVTETADLGLPSLPVSNGRDGVDFTNLLSGTNTLHVWNAGDTKSRVMLTGSFGESDLVRNGSTVWAWNSKAKTATETTLPADRAGHASGNGTQQAPTPEVIAQRALQAIDGSTTVSLDKNRMVAGHKAYELVLTPKSNDTLVGSVRIAVDGTTYLPLAVDVYAKAAPTKAALSVDYTELHYSTPADSVFAFSPPPGTKVTEHKTPTSGSTGSLHGSKRPLTAQQKAEAEKQLQQNVKNVGEGWSSVLIATLPAGAMSSAGANGQGSQGDQWQQLLANLPAVSGKGWTGHALNGTLFSVVLTNDNRVAIGAVPVDRLVADLG